MSRIVPGDDVYGPGSWIDTDALPVPEDARRLLKVLAHATPGFSKDEAVLDAVAFTGSSDPITPGPLKSNVIAAALHGMCGIVANELLQLRDGQTGTSVSVNTDHASFWLGCVGMSKRNGQTVREIAKEGKLASIFPKDLEGGIFGTPLRLRATANYQTKDDGVWFQLHGSLGAEPVLQTLGLDEASQQCASNDEAYKVIAENVRKSGAHELEMMHLVQGLCGSICYTPAGWEQTRMAKDLSRHPLINLKQQTHAVPTPAIPLPVSGDARPLAGIKVVELVRIIAGPVIGTTLAALGADVIRVNCSRLPDFNVNSLIFSRSTAHSLRILIPVLTCPPVTSAHTQRRRSNDRRGPRKGRRR